MTRKLLAPALGLVALCTLAGCPGKGMVDITQIDPPLGDVLARHDVYINNDPALADKDGRRNMEREMYLRSSAMLRKMIDTAREP